MLWVKPVRARHSGGVGVKVLGERGRRAELAQTGHSGMPGPDPRWPGVNSDAKESLLIVFMGEWQNSYVEKQEVFI